MGEMPAMSKLQGQNCIARIYQGKIGCHVGLRAGMG